MTFKTHLALGALGALGVMELNRALDLLQFSHEELFSALGFVLLGSVLPDIDEPRSFIGRKFPLFARLTTLFFEHRGPTHFFIVALCCLILGLSFKSLILASLGFGILCHHFGDLLTPSGIKSYFFPFSYGSLSHTARILPKSLAIKTGSKLELSLVLPLVLAGVAYLSLDIFGVSIDINALIKLVP